MAVDFDGVLHAYTTTQHPFDATNIPDPPVDGAIPWLVQMIRDPRFEVVIFSTRSTHEGGIQAIKDWLHEHGLDASLAVQIGFPTEKPPAWLTIDDRAVQFTGSFPSPEVVDRFKPWNRA